MDQISSRNKFKRILFWFTTIILTIHISLGLSGIFFTINFLPHKLNSFYKKLVVLGPFFSADRIVTSPHVYISTLASSGEWSPAKDMGLESFLEYRHHPWRFDKLKWNDYEQHVARKAFPEIDSLKQIDGSEGNFSKALIRYASMSLPPDIDSIKVLYIWNSWQVESKSVKMDTAFCVTFKPKQSGSPD
jgi:hypothetical protein